MATATATRPAKQGKTKQGKKLSPEAKFVRDYMEDAAEENETLATIIGALSKKEYRAFLTSMAEMAEDYAEALYGDDDDDDDE